MHLNSRMLEILKGNWKQNDVILEIYFRINIIIIKSFINCHIDQESLVLFRQ